MKLLWEERAWDEYCKWQLEDKKTLKRRKEKRGMDIFFLSLCEYK